MISDALPYTLGRLVLSEYAYFRAISRQDMFSVWKWCRKQPGNVSCAFHNIFVNKMLFPSRFSLFKIVAYNVEKGYPTKN
jgi:hypothetical protein